MRCAFPKFQGRQNVYKNKAISMMCGKSPQSDVEMSKTKFRGGYLGFLTGISQSILTKLGTHIYNSLLNKFCSLSRIQISIFLELFQKKKHFYHLYTYFKGP